MPIGFHHKEISVEKYLWVTVGLSTDELKNNNCEELKISVIAHLENDDEKSSGHTADALCNSSKVALSLFVKKSSKLISL